MRETIAAYILWYDGNWECTYIGSNFDDANAANRKAGPADGKAIVWTRPSDGRMVFTEIILARYAYTE